jgi:hypothetical protein
MKFSTIGLTISAVLSLAAVTAPANATSITYDWAVSGVGTSGEVPPGTGTITVTSETNGIDPITAFSGEIGGTTITGLGAATASIDNLLYPAGSPTVFDTEGLAFTTATGSGNIFSFYAQGSTVSPGSVNLDGFSGLPGGFVVGNFTITPVTPVPLPASWAMLLLGVCGVGAVAMRSSRKQAGGQLIDCTAAA